MFNNSKPAKKNAIEGKIEAFLGADTEFQGNITSKGTLRIDGKWEGGNVIADGVIVGESGVIKGSITADSIIIGGKVTGNLSANGAIEILTRAHVCGDIKTPQLSIAEGAIFEGSCSMGETESVTAHTKKEVVPKLEPELS